jgi:hypothetical protein
LTAGTRRTLLNSFISSVQNRRRLIDCPGIHRIGHSIRFLFVSIVRRADS